MSNAPDPIETFRVEANELLESVEQGLLDLMATPGDRDLVDAVFRGLHTLKGSGAMFGFNALAAFTHHCETAFDRVRKGEVAATGDLVSAVLSAKDHMRTLLEGGQDEVLGAQLLARLNEVVAAAAGEGGATAAPARKTWRVVFRLAENALANGANPLAMLAEMRELGACEVRADLSTVPPLCDLAPTQCHIGWDVTLVSECTKSAIED
ncbi:MAG TPA: Hpt domain-containing protein, partial [Verrucomicrobiae bacterium]|nr:Hpt domain-containing protein [Verrucomicrobiae bacterium]